MWCICFGGLLSEIADELVHVDKIAFIYESESSEFESNDFQDERKEEKSREHQLLQTHFSLYLILSESFDIFCTVCDTV